MQQRTQPKSRRPNATTSALLVASNRLPVSLSLSQDEIVVSRSSGGLASALAPALATLEACDWVGWPGAPVEELSRDVIGLRRGLTRRQGAVRLQPVHLSRSEVSGFYNGFSNSVLWPLFHGLSQHCAVGDPYWQAYQDVNLRYAQVISQEGGDDTPCWVHDFHLISVGRHLRALRPDRRLGFFLHIPFPEISVLSLIDQAEQLIADLLAYDVLGFQTVADCERFVEASGQLMQVTKQRLGDERWLVESAAGTSTTVQAFPIGIDAELYAGLAQGPEAEAEAQDIRQDHPGRLLIGVDRLDYTKGLEEKLLAFEELLERYPKFRDDVSLYQLVVPSRNDVPGYAELERRVREVASRVNSRFGRGRRGPVHLEIGTVSLAKLGALYRCADAALVTPLRDGMNLVSKEFCAAQVDGKGVLVLSEQAGAFAQLGQAALAVNPRDTESMVRGMENALEMPERERSQRMAILQDEVHRESAQRWCANFISALVEETGLLGQVVAR